MRSLYWTYFAKKLNNSDLILNTDEFSIRRSIKINYSWGLRGNSIECKNISIGNSIKISLTIASNKMWHWLVTKETIMAPKFVIYLKLLNRWINTINQSEYSKIKLILDNCSTHRWKITKKWLKKANLNVFYLPPYSPQLAHVELWFNILK